MRAVLNQRAAKLNFTVVFYRAMTIKPNLLSALLHLICFIFLKLFLNFKLL